MRPTEDDEAPKLGRADLQWCFVVLRALGGPVLALVGAARLRFLVLQAVMHRALGGEQQVDKPAVALGAGNGWLGGLAVLAAAEVRRVANEQVLNLAS